MESANKPETDFPLTNLALGAFSAEGRGRRLGARIGDMVADLHCMAESGLLDSLDGRVRDALAGESLNAFLECGSEGWHSARALLLSLFSGATSILRDHKHCSSVMMPQWGLSMRLPCEVGDYTDFYASLNHATNVGSMFRPTNPLLPNWKHLPVGYHGRASSLIPTGTPVRRPQGQTSATDEGPPSFGPVRLLDFELEVGAIIGTGNQLGTPIDVNRAWSHIYGMVIVNDWSARDVQKWEYQPLGPFNAKNFATTVSPWVVSMEALEPYTEPALPRPEGDPQPLPYLQCGRDRAVPINLEVAILSESMRQKGIAPHVLCRTNFREMYWSFAQMLAHHTSTGCNMRSGDLLASGTVSGSTKDSRGSMLELSWRGTEPISLPDGSERKFLQDGDEVIMRGYCQAAGLPRIGLGECRGVIQPCAG